MDVTYVKSLLSSCAVREPHQAVVLLAHAALKRQGFEPADDPVGIAGGC